ncbi:MAG: hypothetical protein JNK72_01235 [Myxococcales bacterium]|nr:hypothetical protein [Myxococcales bacterium]
MSTRKPAASRASKADFGVDPNTATRVVESLTQRGDLSALSDTERARFYTQMCEGLGLNPHTQPFAFLKLNGKEVLYATRGATDQLAAIHKLNREIIDGPKVIDLAGTKLVYAVCKVTHPNGRYETATATVPLSDPVNVLMKAETKAKRRATLSLLGLGILDETEVETLPQGPEVEREIDINADLEASPRAPAEAQPGGEPNRPKLPQALVDFYQRLETVSLLGDAVDAWIEHRAAIAGLNPHHREEAWRTLVERTEMVCRIRNAKVVLNKAIKDRDAV